VPPADVPGRYAVLPPDLREVAVPVPVPALVLVAEEDSVLLRRNTTAFG
jgi:hypothetical protein